MESRYLIRHKAVKLGNARSEQVVVGVYLSQSPFSPDEAKIREPGNRNEA